MQFVSVTPQCSYYFVVKQEIVIDIDRNTTVVYGTANGNVTFECPVSGVSSEVTWWRVNEDGEETKLSKFNLIS